MVKPVDVLGLMQHNRNNKSILQMFTKAGLLAVGLEKCVRKRSESPFIYCLSSKLQLILLVPMIF